MATSNAEEPRGEQLSSLDYLKSLEEDLDKSIESNKSAFSVFKVQIAEVKREWEEKRKEKESLEEKMSEREEISKPQITLDVGGKVFEISKESILKQSEFNLFRGIFRMDEMKLREDGSYFIDRNPRFFPKILEFFRTNDGRAFEVSPNQLKEMQEERYYYGIYSNKERSDMKHLDSEDVQCTVEIVLEYIDIEIMQFQLRVSQSNDPRRIIEEFEEALWEYRTLPDYFNEKQRNSINKMIDKASRVTHDVKNRSTIQASPEIIALQNKSLEFELSARKLLIKLLSDLRELNCWKKNWNKLEEKIKLLARNAETKIVFNVSGEKIATLKDNLSKQPDSYLGRLVRDENWKREVDGSYKINLNPENFHLIVDFLRHGKLNIPADYNQYQRERLLEDLDYLQIEVPPESLGTKLFGFKTQ
eukprot:TRINITY_DN13882_c0_g1_i1.p1 TRINITY_DN13882_c0_g1~~TRINITY_DN13882_c0_g1_i1.p1  ORF type:complete len:418 (-),score=83.18 TRINITY_DN13882_c0_g1_i1:44-1297(-)